MNVNRYCMTRLAWTRPAELTAAARLISDFFRKDPKWEGWSHVSLSLSLSGLWPLAFVWPLAFTDLTGDRGWALDLFTAQGNVQGTGGVTFLFLAAFSLKIWAWLNHTWYWYSQLEELQNVTTFEVLQNVRFLCLVFPSFQDSSHTYTVTVATVADLWVRSSEHIHRITQRQNGSVALPVTFYGKGLESKRHPRAVCVSNTFAAWIDFVKTLSFCEFAIPSFSRNTLVVPLCFFEIPVLRHPPLMSKDCLFETIMFWAYKCKTVRQNIDP